LEGAVSVLTVRGGFPVVWQEQVGTAGREHLARVQTCYLQVYTATNPVRVYFSEADFNADENYVAVPVAAAEHPWGWEGPVELHPHRKVWFRGVGGNADVTAVFYQRRG
jgi:hypothetical protein